jgi:hypothetical protein
MARGSLIAVCVGLSLSGAPRAGSAAAPEAASAYKNIEVTRFEVKDGVENFTPDWLLTMDQLLVDRLQHEKVFTEVLREGEEPADPGAPTLKLLGTVTEFKAGSRMKRYLIGFGAGKTVIRAHVTWIDKSNGQVVFEDDVDGKVILGYTGGESIGATQGLAHEVAKVTKKKFFKKN